MASAIGIPIAAQPKKQASIRAAAALIRRLDPGPPAGPEQPDGAHQGGDDRRGDEQDEAGVEQVEPAAP